MREGRCVMVRNEKKEMTAGEIADKICEIAPEALQETWDKRSGTVGVRNDRNASSVTVFGDQKIYG